MDMLYLQPGLLEGAIGSASFEKHDAPLLGVCSMKTATEFTRCYDDNTTLPTTTRATLVAATSSHTSSFL
ncbi:hypothetical protein CIB48_g6858 [Xylaria polymorpha]|nr:hypothetical protein CIB48_g6858 [Xylaria polymorpha]